MATIKCDICGKEIKVLIEKTAVYSCDPNGKHSLINWAAFKSKPTTIDNRLGDKK